MYISPEEKKVQCFQNKINLRYVYVHRGQMPVELLLSIEIEIEWIILYTMIYDKYSIYLIDPLNSTLRIQGW